MISSGGVTRVKPINEEDDTSSRVSSAKSLVSSMFSGAEVELDISYTQARVEDFQLGVALRISARAAREKFLSATPKFLSATPIFGF